MEGELIDDNLQLKLDPVIPPPPSEITPSPSILPTTIATSSETTKDNGPFITINIGGIKYETTFDTLCKEGNNYFTDLIRDGKIASVRDSQGNYFIDRDGQSFGSCFV